MATQTIRLTEMAHGGGCGCKLAPAVLREILAKMPPNVGAAQLLSDAHPDVIVFHCTDTSMTQGPQGEGKILDIVKDATGSYQAGLLALVAAYGVGAMLVLVMRHKARGGAMVAPATACFSALSAESAPPISAPNLICTWSATGHLE